MDIITIIEKYVELNARHNDLNNTIENSKRYYTYAKIEGDMAYYEKDFQAEKGYNDSARHYSETEKEAKSEREQVEELLRFTHEAYIKTIESLDALQVKETAGKISLKKDDIERQIADLTKRRNWAITNGNEAFATHNFEEEQEYNKIASECYFELERLKPILHYYKAFVNDLNYRAYKKINQNFGQDGLGR